MNLRSIKKIVYTLLFSVLIILTSYWYVNKDNDVDVNDENLEKSEEVATADDIRGVEENDHVMGNPNAPIMFFVYSDFSCQFCKEHHETMRRIVSIYGKDGEVALVFRHFPLVQLHPEAPMYALASECVAEQLGNVGFWKFADELFELSDPIEPLDATELVVLAESVGASRQGFVSCMRSNKFMQRVESDFEEARSAGADGSPYTIIQALGDRAVMQGAQKYRTMAMTVQSAVRSLGVTELESPTATSSFNSSLEEQFKDFDIATSSMQNASGTASTNVSTTSTKLNDVNTGNEKSILDGIID